MKKLLTAVVAFAIFCSMFSGLTIVSATAAFPAAPADWTVLLSENFDANANTNLSSIVYDASNPNFSSGWTVTGTSNQAMAIVNANGQLQMTHSNTYGKTVTSTINLKNPIDLTVDADYYVTFDATLPSMGAVASSTFRLANSTNNAAAPQLNVGATQNNSDPPYGPYISNLSAKGTSSNYYGGDTTRAYTSGAWQTVLLHFTVRNSNTGKIGTYQMRTFYDTDTETPSYTPSFWDQERNVSLSNLGSSPTTFNQLILTGTHNSGSSPSSAFDNIKIYKSAPISNYKVTTQTDPTLISGHAIVGQNISFDAPAATNLLGQTISVISADTGWYDCSTDPPTKLTDSYTYTIPSSMYGKKLKAVLTTEANGVRTTYEPFVGYVRLALDYVRVLNGAPGAAASFDSKDYTKWANWSIGNIDRLTFYVYMNTNLSNTKALGLTESSGIVLAQYAADGSLKSVMSTPYRALSTYTSAQTAGRIGLIFPVTRPNLSDPSTWNVAKGDYFKVFVLWSNGSAFTYDSIKPMLISPSTDSSLAPSSVLYTVPIS